MPLAHGRPRKINTKVQNEIVKALQVGSTYEMACRYAGVKYDTFLNWMKRGRDAWAIAEKAREEARNVTLVWKSVPRKKKTGRPPKNKSYQPRVLSETRYIPEKLPPDLINLMRIPASEVAFVHFFHAIEEANGVAEIGWLEVIDTTAQRDAVWAAWQLAHRLPEVYGNAKKQIELSTPPDAPIQINQNVSGEVSVKVADVDRIADVLRILAEVGALESGALGAAESGTDSEADQVRPD